MSDTPKKIPDGVVFVDVGCFRQKSPKEMAEETSPEYLEAALKRILEDAPPQPPAERGKGKQR
jgi:hypothetical protein